MDCVAVCKPRNDAPPCFRTLCYKIQNEQIDNIERDRGYFVCNLDQQTVARLHRDVIHLADKISFCPPPLRRTIKEREELWWNLESIIPHLESRNLATCTIHPEINGITTLQALPHHCYRAAQAVFYDKISVKGVDRLRVKKLVLLKTRNETLIIDRRHIKKDLGAEVCPSGRAIDESTTVWLWPTNDYHVGVYDGIDI